MSKANKIKARTIEVLDCEANAPDFNKYPLTFDSWSDINLFILRQAITIKSNKTYLKMKFRITFEDGTTYLGRYDIQNEKVDDWNLGKHITRYLQYLAKHNIEKRDQAINFLNNYEIFQF